MLTILVLCIFSLSRMRSQLVLCDKVTIIYRSMVASGWLVLGGAGGAGCVVCFYFFAFFFFLMFRIFFPYFSYFVFHFLFFSVIFCCFLLSFSRTLLPFFAKKGPEEEGNQESRMRWDVSQQGFDVIRRRECARCCVHRDPQGCTLHFRGFARTESRLFGSGQSYWSSESEAV